MITEVPPDCTVQTYRDHVKLVLHVILEKSILKKKSSVSLYFLNVVQFKLTVWYFL